MHVYACLKVFLIAYWIDAADAAAKVMWNSTYTDQLKHDLLYKYDKFARPSQHFNLTSVVMELTVRHVQIDELKSMMIANAWYRLEWIDEKLKWDVNEYGGMTNLHVGDHEIWQPDIVLYNSALANIMDHYGNTHCIVKYDGTVLWVPPTQLVVFCRLDMTWWPYDTQNCEFHFGSWVYSGAQVNLTADEGQRPILTDEDNGEWKVVSIHANAITVLYNCCPEPYHKVTYTVTVKRRSPAYHAILFTPAAMSVVLTLSVFWLTPSALEKFLVSGVTTIIISMHLIYLAQRLPTVALNTPVIVQFYSANLLLVCLSIAVSVITHNISHHAHSRPVPWIISKHLTGKIGRLLLLPITKNSVFMESYSDKGDEELQECNLVKEECSNRSGHRKESDWLLVAIALDRIMFLIYVILFLSLALYCII